MMSSFNGIYVLSGPQQDRYFLNRSNNHVIKRCLSGEWVMAPWLGLAENVRTNGVGILSRSFVSPSPLDTEAKWVFISIPDDSSCDDLKVDSTIALNPKL